MFLGYRSTDPVITIFQDNKRKSVDIRDTSGPLGEVLGYKDEELTAKPLADFVPARIATLLNEYVEYEDDGNDVGSVLSKVQSFCLTGKDGKEHAFRLKVLRSESLDGNAYFKLILQNQQDNRRNEAFRAALRENFRGHEVLDPATNLPDRNSLIKDTEFTLFYINNNQLAACFAVIELDDYETIVAKHGKDIPAKMLTSIAGLARQNLRTDDVIGSLPPKRLGLILLDTNLESARMVLNRLRWLIAAHPFELPGNIHLPMTASIGFTHIGGHVDDKSLVQDSEVFMDRITRTSGNLIQEIPADIEVRSAQMERRSQNVPVVFDRRKTNRRREE